uniref:Uncharacterized protein n=1 Tax=Arundo donax TaxID=35708 RepID=A0A0A9FUM5_ARUDO
MRLGRHPMATRRRRSWSTARMTRGGTVKAMGSRSGHCTSRSEGSGGQAGRRETSMV